MTFIQWSREGDRRISEIFDEKKPFERRVFKKIVVEERARNLFKLSSRLSRSAQKENKSNSMAYKSHTHTYILHMLIYVCLYIKQEVLLKFIKE